jgi:two-component system chemotaxis response regulator CheB
MNPAGRRQPRQLLVADRAASFRLAVERLLASCGTWTVATAGSIVETRDKFVQLNPDFLVLEADMPGNENSGFVNKLLRYRSIPVIALANASKPAGPYSAVILRDKGDDHAAAELLRLLTQWSETRQAPSRRHASYKIIAIGASTGGTEAVERLLQMLPADGPGVVIAQHIPKQFSLSFAERLNRVTPLEVRQAVSGDVIYDGLALVAPGDQHLRIALAGDHWRVELDSGPKVWHQRPAVDVLFNSVAKYAAPHAVGILLTGMGSDGAAGLSRMRDAGCWTIAQNEASCVVFGMPRAAIEAGAACEVVALDRIAAAVETQFHRGAPTLSRS